MRRRVAQTRATVVALRLAIVALATAIPTITEGAGATGALGDPLESAECQRALAALSGEEAAVAESSHANNCLAASPACRSVFDAPVA